MSLRARLIVVFLTAVVVRIGFQFWTGFVADDAFITFRYAENLAAGYGFVYNVGERVLGTSTPLFTWILSVLVIARIPVGIGALGLSLICSGLTAVLLYRFAGYLRFGSLAWLPAIAYAFWPRSVPAETSGMETALFVLLVTAAFYFFHRRLHYYAIGCATLSFLTRPEGIILLGVVLAGAIWRNRRRWGSYVATAGLLILPWLVFAQFYFGSVIPHSITAKLALYSRFGTESWWDNLVFMMGWHNPAGWVLTAAAVAGAWWLHKKQNIGRAEIIWLILTVAFFSVSQTHMFFWYPAPLYPMLILLASAAALYLVDYFGVVTVRHGWAVGLVLLVATVELFGLARAAGPYREQQQYAEGVLKPAGLFLAEKADRNLSLVAAEDIGYLGYFSKCRILDRDGLISPNAVEYNREGRYLDLIVEHQPDWVGVTVGSPISGFVTDSTFIANYQAARVFKLEDAPEYELYRRK